MRWESAPSFTHQAESLPPWLGVSLPPTHIRPWSSYLTYGRNTALPLIERGRQIYSSTCAPYLCVQVPTTTAAVVCAPLWWDDRFRLFWINQTKWLDHHFWIAGTYKWSDFKSTLIFFKNIRHDVVQIPLLIWVGNVIRDSISKHFCLPFTKKFTRLGERYFGGKLGLLDEGNGR